MTGPTFDVGAYVWGGKESARDLKPHARVFNAYADGTFEDDREAYLSHFAFGQEMRSHYKANRNSVAGYAGPAWCRRHLLDIDRTDLVDALNDARRLVQAVRHRYDLEAIPVYFSGAKGFHVLIELTPGPPPAVNFPRTARTFAEALAATAGVKIDTAVYDVNRIGRLPNTRHPRTGLFKRRIDPDDLFRFDVAAVLEHARHPAGDGIPAFDGTAEKIAADWHAAERAAVTVAATRAVIRRDVGTSNVRAPKFFLDFLRFGVEEGERHATLFRAAAWMSEQGAPPSLVSALLTEPGCDVALTPKDVARQIQCGIAHALKQRAADPAADPETAERWAIVHEDDPTTEGAA